LADVMDAILSLDDSISNKIFNHMETLDKKGGASEAEGEITPVEEIMAEIHNLNDHITATKQEIAALKTDSESNTPIATATEELAEVVKTTEEAANAILENAELIDGVVAELRGKIPQGDPDDLGPNVDKLEFIGMELMTACSFQDLTGQRINKVVNSLNYIEERLQKMIEIWNIEHGTADPKQMTFAKDDDCKDKDLLSGPQAKEDAMGQDDIDAMFD
jgi:chemotaxis protein CheZ